MKSSLDLTCVVLIKLSAGTDLDNSFNELTSSFFPLQLLRMALIHQIDHVTIYW